MTQQEIELLIGQGFATSETTSELAKGMIGFHKQQKPIKKEGLNPSLKSKYLKLDTILEDTKEALIANDLWISQSIIDNGIVTVVMHMSGEWMASLLPCKPMDGNNGTNSLQKAGGGYTYAKRYAICAILGIAADEDSDGADGGVDMGKKPTTAKPTPQAEAKKPTMKAVTWEQAKELELTPQTTKDSTKNDAEIVLFYVEQGYYTILQKDSFDPSIYGLI
jgi:hypothetical protein